MNVDDKQLEQLAKHLGVNAAARLDVDQTARVVVERLKSEPERVVWWRRPRILSVVASAAVIFVAVGILANGRNDTTALDLEPANAPLDLQALSFDELEEVFDTLTFEAPVSELSFASLDDMSVGQLEELPQTMMEE